MLIQYNCKRLRLLNLMNIIDSYFGTFHEISIRCFEMQFSDTDKSIVENSRMLRKGSSNQIKSVILKLLCLLGVRFFEMVAPPFAIEMMKMTNRLNPVWLFRRWNEEENVSGVANLSLPIGAILTSSILRSTQVVCQRRLFVDPRVHYCRK